MESMAGEIRWVVRAEDGATLGEIVARAGSDAAAIAEGRVFVGRVRAKEAESPVRVGDVVTVGPIQEAAESVAVLLDEGGLVAADKPAGMPTIPDQGGASHSLLAVLAKKLRCSPSALHPTSRLDRDVSGIVVFARTSEAAARLTQARATGAYFRRYVAIASRPPVLEANAEPGRWNAPIGRAKDPKKRAAFGRDATEATSLYAVVASAEARSLLALEPVTGRTHQLRVHAANAQAPLLGDRAYGGDSRVVLSSGHVLGLGRIALHAGLVVVPGRAAGAGGVLEVRSPVPRELRDLWRALGGNEEAWALALEGPRLALGSEVEGQMRLPSSQPESGRTT
jgi:23S rRNA-/tRNA-specific pseudouridylate synthase